METMKVEECLKYIDNYNEYILTLIIIMALLYASRIILIIDDKLEEKRNRKISKEE
ncbi:hypothetical protein [Photobacterium profundum]|uniref:Uncharacterized protein n=1 Tax=Photobacterium profundum 3TCK TaxID=314280 RepID=Q1Z4Y9_9GAMM|nr:hypothetical protein [Photobacterium profundum]EAS43482.1 hypothetical protein P3TCK_01459 [Photobacterium profundum 3TCK]